MTPHDELKALVFRSSGHAHLDEGDSYHRAGIDVEGKGRDHFERIVVYGEGAEEAEALRDTILAAFKAQEEVERLREALELADAALRGANMNMNVVERKVRAALAGKAEQ